MSLIISVDDQMPSSTIPSAQLSAPEEGAEDSAYEEEWAPNEQEEIEGQRPPHGNGGSGTQTQRFLPETNTLENNLEHFGTTPLFLLPLISNLQPNHEVGRWQPFEKKIWKSQP
jgi:hypothetical protein